MWMSQSPPHMPASGRCSSRNDPKDHVVDTCPLVYELLDMYDNMHHEMQTTTTRCLLLQSISPTGKGPHPSVGVGVGVGDLSPNNRRA